MLFTKGLQRSTELTSKPAVIQVESLQDSAGETTKWFNINNPVRSAG